MTAGAGAGRDSRSAAGGTGSLVRAVGPRGQSASAAAPAVRVEVGRASRRLGEVWGGWRVPLCFHQAGPGQCVPWWSSGSVRGPWPGCCVERELCAPGPGFWGGSASPPVSGQAGGCMPGHPPGQVAQPRSKPTSTLGDAQPPALGRPFTSCRVPGSGGQCLSLPGGVTSPCVPLCPAPLGSPSFCGAEEMCQRRCCSCPATGTGEEKASEG